MNNKRIFAVILALCLLTLGGCQLAKPEGDAAPEPDMLVGAYITTEYLDLFDMDAYLSDNIDDIVGGGEIEIEDTTAYDGRIYAEPVVLTETVDGEPFTHTEYVFPELEGMMLASYRVFDGDSDNMPYWSYTADDGLCDVCTFIGDNHGITGTVYVDSNGGEIEFYINPVYQTESGEIYLMSGGGGHILDPQTIGTMTTTLSETYTENDNGEIREVVCDVEITFDTATPAETVVLIQMDENNHELCRNEFAPDEMPEELVPIEGAAYILVEEHGEGGVVRSICQKSDDLPAIEVFQSPDGTICIMHQTLVLWAED